MEKLNFRILWLLEREGPKTTQEIAEEMDRSKYSIEKRLLRLSSVREVQSKIHGPSIWWIPSLYEYMLRIAEVRLIKLGMKPHINQSGLDFYGEGKEGWVGGICTSILDKEWLEEEFNNEKKRIDERIILTERPPDWTIKGVDIWTLSENSTAENVSLIPVDVKLAGRLKDMSDKDKDFKGFCTGIIKKGIEAKRWGF